MELWIPVRPLRKSAGGLMRIGGLATVDNVVDLDQELLQHTGVIDCLSYLSKFGKVNWNHGGAAGDMLGDITVAEIRKSNGRTGLWIEATLNPNVGQAVDAYKFMQGGGRLGFSVQGVTLKLTPRLHKGVPVKEVESAFVTQVALTAEPKNYATFATILKSMAAGSIAKSLTAGAGTDAAQFTGGRALTEESFGPSRATLQLARHFHAIHGDLPRNDERFQKALSLFTTAWGLSDEHKAALARHMKGES